MRLSYTSKHYKSQLLRVILHNDEIESPPRMYNSSNLCVPSDQASKYIKQKFRGLKIEIDISKIKVGNFNIPLSVIDRAC